jgi:hypothetical protein
VHPAPRVRVLALSVFTDDSEIDVGRPFADNEAGRSGEQFHGTNAGVRLKTLADGQNQAVQRDVVRHMRGVAHGAEIDGIELGQSL